MRFRNLASVRGDAKLAEFLDLRFVPSFSLCSQELSVRDARSERFFPERRHLTGSPPREANRGWSDLAGFAVRLAIFSAVTFAVADASAIKAR